MTDITWEQIRANRSALYVGRKPSISKHRATNTAHLRALLDRLDAAGDAEAADTIAWLLWWEAINTSRERFLIEQHYEMLADKIGEAMGEPTPPPPALSPNPSPPDLPTALRQPSCPLPRGQRP